jgi:hypothetical protein
MIFLLTAQMGIFIHLKSFRVNQIVFVVAAVTLSSIRINPTTVTMRYTHTNHAQLRSTEIASAGKSASYQFSILAAVFVGRSVADQFVIFPKLRWRPNRLPDIEAGRLQLEHELVES